MTPSPIVFDSWALLALLQDENAASAVEALLLECLRGDKQAFISVINLGEVWYALARKSSEEIADHKVSELVATGIEVRAADWPLTRQAAAYKAKYRMSYADCFAAALAKYLDAELVTGDPEFKQVEDEVRIRWLER